MATITKTDLIERISQISPSGDADAIARSVEAAIAQLGWSGRDVFDGADVIAIGTRMAEATQAELAASANPTDQAQAEAMTPYLETMRQDVLPHLKSKS